jgi:4-hydroxythreonine-4-phosphate dehydrogenase
MQMVSGNGKMSTGPQQREQALRHPVLAITMGDASGIGPEIIVRTLMRPRTYEICCPLVVGDVSVIQATITGMDVGARIHRVGQVKEASFSRGTIDVLDLANIQLDKIHKGQIDPMAGRATVEYVVKAVELAQSGEVDGIVTAPLHKQAIHQAGFDYPGHTELLAEKTGTTNFAMMFVAGDLRVILVTIHCSLRQALETISRDIVLEKIRLAQRAMRRLGIEQPRIAVAGINPHAGEGGMFGREEVEILEPAVNDAQAEGINATGPYPGDTIFNRAVKGQFDIVVAMYHDQGLIPVKLMGFGKGVNITLGLPFVRTSVDHGTAFGKAWEWRADPGSMIAAVELAAQMVTGTRRNDGV